MPSNNCHIQTGSCMAIAVPLDETCAIVTAAPSIVTAGFGEFNMEPEVETGTDYSAKNFGGVRCGPELKAPDRTKWGNGTGNICLVDWALQSATSGNPTVVDDDGNVVGYQELVTANASTPCADDAEPPRLAFAIIRRAATGDGGCAPVAA